MKANTLNKIAILVLIPFLTLQSCKSRKSVKPAIVDLKIDSSLSAASVNDLLAPTIKDWKYFSTKCDIDYSGGGKSISSTAHIRMLKDSLIWISAGLYGIEGVRIIINNDSAVMINKLEKSYTVFKNGLLKGVSDLPLTVTQIQNLLMAKPLFALKFYKFVNTASENLYISNSQEKFNTTHHYVKENLTLDSTLIKDRFSETNAMAVYTDFSVIHDRNLQQNTVITANDGKNSIRIELKYSNPDFQTELSFPFKIPESYEKSK